MREAEGYREVLLAIREAYGMEIQALTVQQVATCLNCDERTVKMLIVKKKLHAVDISFGKKNHRYRIPVDALARYLTKK
jgi:excisionase family DNA binding protein